MSALVFLILGLDWATQPETTPRMDTARLREMLRDRTHLRTQSQAALLLVQSRNDEEAVEEVRQGLRQTESVEIFIALTAAVRLCRDTRFNGELVDALTAASPTVRQSAEEALAVLVDTPLLRRLQALAADRDAELSLRQAVIRVLGRSGRQEAVVVLLDSLSDDDEGIRKTAQDALTELTGQTCGRDLKRWRIWWEAHRDLPADVWQSERFAYQESRTRRLVAELERTKAEVLKLHQQLYARLPAADRLAHLQAVAEHAEGNVRALAAAWAVELWSGTDAVGQNALADVLLRLSRDSLEEVQKPAVLALGRVTDPRVVSRLITLLRKGRTSIRVAAARSLAQQAILPGQTHLQSQVVPALQRAIEDPAIEVVIEAAEGLGTLGVPEAIPMLADLLRHSSDQVRQTAAHAIERVADRSILDALLKTLDDPAATVRFSVVGAIGRAAATGGPLPADLQARIVVRLEDLLLRDTDPGVRSRAATVLGECGGPAVMTTLWQRVEAAEDARVVDKAWEAIVTIAVRAHSIELLKDWERRLSDSLLVPRKLHLLQTAVEQWKMDDSAKSLSDAATALLIQAHLDQGKWTAALPLVRELLAKPVADADVEQRLRWLVMCAELALKDDNRGEVQRIVQDARPLLSRKPTLAAEFDRLSRLSQKAP
jgi:HEAT repeat protein